jgi:hypothetical protein
LSMTEMYVHPIYLVLTLLCFSSTVVGTYTSWYSCSSPMELAYSDYDGGRIYIMCGTDNVYVYSYTSDTIAPYTLGGSGTGGSTLADARFLYATGLAMHCGTRRLFVIDFGNHCVRAINEKTGAVTNYAGGCLLSPSFQDGLTTSARFNYPASAAIHTNQMYVSEMGGSCIRKVNLYNGYVSLFAGSCGDFSGPTMGNALTTARFNSPSRIAVSADGHTVFVIESATSQILQIRNGIVSALHTFGGGFSDVPVALAVNEGTGQLYVAASAHVVELTGWTSGTATEVVVSTDLAAASGVMITPTGQALASYGDYLRREDTPLVSVAPWNQRCEVQAQLAKMRINDRARHVAGLNLGGELVTGACASTLLQDPQGLAVDNNFLYVSDKTQHVIVRISKTTFVSSVFIGSKGTYGLTDNVYGTAALVAAPMGMCVTTLGGIANLVVADSGAHRLRIVRLSDGYVQTLAGSTSGTPGLQDGGSALFRNPAGIACITNQVFVADTNNHNLRKWIAGSTTRIAGSSIGASGADNGNALTTATFTQPTDLATTDGDTFYIADYSNSLVRKLVVTANTVTTLFGSGTCAVQIGLFASAAICSPRGVALLGANLYVTDLSGNVVMKADATTVSIASGSAISSAGAEDGVLAVARTMQPTAVCVDGNVLYYADGTARIRQIITNVTTDTATFCGVTLRGDYVGTLTTARFNSPTAMALDKSLRVIYVTDQESHRIKSIDLAGAGGVANVAGNGQCVSTTAGLCYPTALTRLSNGDLIVSVSQRLKKVSAGVVTAYAGSATPGFGDNSIGTSAQFQPINNIAIDSNDNIFVADNNNARIRKVQPSSASQKTTTVAGTGTAGSVDGAVGTSKVGNSASLLVAVDSHNDVIFSDFVSPQTRIRRLIMPIAVVTTLTTQTYSDPVTAITVDVNDDIYYVVTRVLYRIIDGVSTPVLFFGASTAGHYNADQSTSKFEQITSMAFLGDDLYFVDQLSHRIGVITSITETQTITVSRTLTTTITRSRTLPPTRTKTIPPTPSRTRSRSRGTRTATASDEFSQSMSEGNFTMTRTPSRTRRTVTASASKEQTQSRSKSRTKSVPVTKTVPLSETVSLTSSYFRYTVTALATDSASQSFSFSHWQTRSATILPTQTPDASVSEPITISLSKSHGTKTPSRSISRSKSRRTVTVSVPTSISFSVSASATVTGGSGTGTASDASYTAEGTATTAVTVSKATVTMSASADYSETVSASGGTTSRTVTSARSKTLSGATLTFSAPASVSATFTFSALVSKSLSLVLTRSQSTEITTSATVSASDSVTMTATYSKTRNPWEGLRLRVLDGAGVSASYTANQTVVVHIAADVYSLPINFIVQPYRDDGSPLTVTSGLSAIVTPDWPETAAVDTVPLVVIPCSGVDLPCVLASPQGRIVDLGLPRRVKVNITSTPAPADTMMYLRVVPGAPREIRVDIGLDSPYFVPHYPLSIWTRRRFVTVTTRDRSWWHNVVDINGTARLWSPDCVVRGGTVSRMIAGTARFADVILSPKSPTTSPSNCTLHATVAADAGFPHPGPNTSRPLRLRSATLPTSLAKNVSVSPSWIVANTFHSRLTFEVRGAMLHVPLLRLHSNASMVSVAVTCRLLGFTSAQPATVLDPGRILCTFIAVVGLAPSADINLVLAYKDDRYGTTFAVASIRVVGPLHAVTLVLPAGQTRAITLPYGTPRVPIVGAIATLRDMADNVVSAASNATVVRIVVGHRVAATMRLTPRNFVGTEVQLPPVVFLANDTGAVPISVVVSTYASNHSLGQYQSVPVYVTVVHSHLCETPSLLAVTGCTVDPLLPSATVGCSVDGSVPLTIAGINLGAQQPRQVFVGDRSCRSFRYFNRTTAAVKRIVAYGCRGLSSVNNTVSVALSDGRFAANTSVSVAFANDIAHIEPDVAFLASPNCVQVHPNLAQCAVADSTIQFYGRNLSAVLAVRLRLPRNVAQLCLGPVTYTSASNVSANSLPLGVNANDVVTVHGCSGFGRVRVYELLAGDGSVLVSRTYPDKPTIKFAASKFALCVANASGALCGHGTCDVVRGQCVCDSSPTSGYWAGPNCSACQSGYALARCRFACPLGSNNVTCGGWGTCDSTTGGCVCHPSRQGPSCDASCPGTPELVCGGHGACSYDVGTTATACVCHSSNVTGYWAAATRCTTCASGFVGANCTVPCPTHGGATCGGRGFCLFNGSHGVCHCQGGCGDSCEVDLAHCDSCASPIQYGASCSACPAAVSTSQACAGHGLCSAGKTGTGQCYCDPGYTTADCSQSCSGGSAAPCSNHGFCLDSSATCACEAGYFGRACQSRCPGNVAICSGRGRCDDGVTGSGNCTCDAGYMGIGCEAECPRNALTNAVCSSHGTCTQRGCVCSNDATTGFFTEADCGACAENYYGASCTSTCAFGVNSTTPCGGHGACRADLTCTCTGNLQQGYWGGALCDRCRPGYYGWDCLGECPGSACNPCQGNGACFDGLRGNGTCACSRANGSSYGNADCSDCSVDRYGAKCDLTCPTNADGTCGAHGRCDYGVAGGGFCVCDNGFTNATSGGTCSECSANHYGPRCTACLPTAANACSGGGSCHSGLGGDGNCTCNYGRVGRLCEYTCPMTGGVVCNGHGTCSQGRCTCNGYWALESPTTGSCTRCAAGVYGGSCSFNCPTSAGGLVCTGHGACSDGTSGDGSCRCANGWYGPLCAAECPGGAGNPCSGHGQCSGTTGECTCTASVATGFYSGYRCDRCDPAYESASCDVQCPRPSNGADVCNSRGTCWAGTCVDCAPNLGLHDSIDLVVCGSACETLVGCPSGSSCADVTKWGAACTSTCAGIVGGVPCTGHGICRRSKRPFPFSEGIGGAACEVNCPLVAGLVCNGHGECDYANATGCICSPGYAGVDCTLQCPRDGNNLVCGGQGACDRYTGSCRCAFGFAGASCTMICNGGLANPCSGHGQCNQLTGRCACTRNASHGFYDGSDCSRCYGRYAGPACDVVCSDHSLPLADRCVCDPGWAARDCTVGCPGVALGTVNVCGGHGTCDDGDGGNGTCTCDADYYLSNCSAYCTVDDCRTTYELENPTCTSNGTCTCQDDLNGHFTGSLCDQCQLFYWGPTCALRCLCNEHGGCDRNTGDCYCFNDDTRGYWGGSDCSTCAAGYIGVECRGINIQVSPVDWATESYSVRFSDPGATVTATDGNVLVVANDLIVIFNVSSSLSKPELIAQYDLDQVASPDAMPSADLSGSVVTVHFAEEAITVGVEWSNGTTSRVHFRSSDLSTLSILSIVPGPNITLEDDLATTRAPLPTTAPPTVNVSKATAYALRRDTAPWSARRRLLAVNPATTALAVVSDAANTTDYRPHGNGVITIRQQGRAELWSTQSPIELVTTADIVGTFFVVYGSINVTESSGDQWALAYAPLPLRDGLMDQWTLLTSHQITLTACVGTQRRCRSVERCTLVTRVGITSQLVCLLVGSDRTLVAARFDVTATDIRTTTYGSDTVAHPNSGSLTALKSASVDVTSMLADDGIGLVVAAFNEGSTPSSIIKIEVATLSLTGLVMLDYFAGDPEIVQAMHIRPETRELLVHIQLPYTVRLRTFNLFGVRRVTPSIIDAAGGTVIRVDGEGFSAFAPPWCDFGGGDLRVSANVLSAASVECTAPKSRKDDTCTSISFNVLFGERTTSTTNVPLLRPASVSLSALATPLGGALGSVANATRVTMIGVGFVRSAYAACRLVDQTGRVLFESGNGTVQFINSTAVVCIQPGGLRSSVPPAYLAYTHDGQVYGSSKQLYAVVGAASALDATSYTVTATADTVTRLPPITVRVIDLNGNALRY